MQPHDLIALTGCALSLFGSALYIRSILKGKTHPHLYSHLVWLIVMGVAFCAQLQGGAGAGAWITGAGVLAVLGTTLLSLKYGEKNITRSDRFALTAALLAIIPWLITRDPFWSVILVTAIDMTAYYPTLRKSWHAPWSEDLRFYAIGSIEFALSLLALSNYSVITALYPAALIAGNSILIALCLLRRQALRNSTLRGS